VISAVPSTAPAADVTAAAPAAPAATVAATPQVAPGFDAILMLQSLAATAENLDAASFEAGDTADLFSTEDAEDEDEGDELESSLAFLSALLTATTPRSSAGDMQAGAQAQGGATDEGASALAARNPAADSAPGFVLNAESTEKSDALLNLAAMPPEPLETRSAGDAAQNLARAAEMLLQAQRPAAAAAATEQAKLATNVRDPRWADDLGARVSLMVRGGESTASLALTPVDLGPMEVSVTVKDSQATIHFGASHAETRALIEASLPRLRELLAAQGFNLTDASVSSGFSRSQQQPGSQGSGAAGESETATTDARVVRSIGLLDLYA
jgi:flagellar hook-length control protein FliK